MVPTKCLALAKYPYSSIHVDNDHAITYGLKHLNDMSGRGWHILFQQYTLDFYNFIYC